jgi:RES domain-containing protein
MGRLASSPFHRPHQGRGSSTDWREFAARDKLQAIGSGWARKCSAAVLAVPSAVIPAETNYLLNPLHADFRRIRIGKPEKFETDLRSHKA